MKTKLIFSLAFLVLVAACKKKEDVDPSDNSNNSSGGASVLFVAPKVESADYMTSSFDGKIFVKSKKNKIDYSINEGQTWAAIYSGLSNPKTMQVSNGGYLVLEDDNNKHELYNLNSGINLTFGVAGFYNEYYLGADDYIYCIQGTNSSKSPILFFKSVNASKWDTLSTKGDSLGFYCGQDQNGGVAFYNTSTKRFYIHNPVTKIFSSKTIDINLGNLGSSQPNRFYSFSYNGYDKLGIAYNKTAAIADVNTAVVSYLPNWPLDFSGYYENPISFDINKEGEVLVKLSSYTTNGDYIFKNNTYTKQSVRAAMFANGKYTYKLGQILLEKTTPTSNSTLSSPDGIATQLKSGTKHGNDVYLLANSGDVSNILIKYSISGNSFSNIERGNGNYKYIYSDDSKIYLYGTDSTLVSSDNGTSWKSSKNTSAKPITFVIKASGKYYGLHTRNFKYNLGGTGFQVDQHDIVVYSSSDAVNWTEIIGTAKTGQSGLSPGAVSVNGLMAQYYNINPLGNQEIITNYSSDFGINWKSNSKLISNSNLAKETGEIYNITVYNNEITLIEYNGDFTAKSTKKYQVSNTTQNSYEEINSFFKDGSFYLCTESSFIKF